MSLHNPPEPLTRCLQGALQTGEIWPAFQPLVHLGSRQVAGFEVLARWTSPELGPVSPADFIPLADRMGWLHGLSLTLIEQACRQVRDWPGTFYLAFNLAPSQFLRPDLADQVQATVEQAGFFMQRVRVEITENALFHDNQVARQSIEAFKRAGASLSLDDFGTGHSSLTRLQSLPFDEIKIDASFVRGLESDSHSLKIVTAVLGLGQSLGVHVIAEGIETTGQAELLTRLGCAFGQGFGLGRPGPAEQALAHLIQAGCHGDHDRPLDASPFQRLHQLETLYLDAPVGLCFIDTEMRVVSANPKVLRYLGLSGRDLRGRPVAQVLNQPLAQGLLSALEAVRVGAVLPPTQYSHEGTDSTYLVAHQRVSNPLGECLGISLVVIDISERVKAEQALQQSEEHFRRSIELGPNIAWGAAADGVVDYMGPAFEWTPLSSARERYERWRERMDPDDRERVHREWLAHLPTPRPFKTEFRILWPDNTWRWVRSQGFPHLDEQGQVVRWYGIIMDISAERRLEQRLAELEHKVVNLGGACA
ncbi:EAL domain-containing protein [Curvibacter sp. HBC61]|uniref:EAL domain-containing protein n=1 Tax=Curvibacter cyanobacteriorum TaxID=3026422 RepID=A0ABT5N399_9BURK|nr:EAL domain-containing protein [Curvibacter sp. HBC61]MDD0840794.1 EAL domain-containing protein [Curvibacter sp. HBC61]